jgi:hypothetical protein
MIKQKREEIFSDREKQLMPSAIDRCTSGREKVHSLEREVGGCTHSESIWK